MSSVNEFWQLNGEIGHWLFEIEGGLIAAAIGATWHQWWSRRHDRRNHALDEHREHAFCRHSEVWRADRAGAHLTCQCCPAALDFAWADFPMPDVHLPACVVAPPDPTKNANQERKLGC